MSDHRTNIRIDISSLPYNRGVSRYTSNLVRALMQQSALNLSAYGSSFRQYENLKRSASDLGLSQDKILIDRLPPSLLPLAWRFNRALPYRKSKKPLVFHAWDWHLPPTSDSATNHFLNSSVTKQVGLVTTIHDLAMLKFPKTAHPKILAHHQKVWQQLKERNIRIVAVSQTTRRDIIELLGISEQRITVVPEAMPAEIEAVSANMSENQHRLIRDKLELNKPFLLFVGTTEPRKNLQRIIEAWRPLADDYQLIIAGARGWDQLELNGGTHGQTPGGTPNRTSGQTSQSSGGFKPSTNPNLRFLGPIDDGQLSVLYAEASALVFASLYEGFGLPILEAFHHGTPVITSNNSGMKEVAGNAAELVDPHSVESIRAGIQRILDEDVEAQQLRLKKMIIRGQVFSWESAARQMVKVYQQAEDEI